MCWGGVVSDMPIDMPCRHQSWSRRPPKACALVGLIAVHLAVAPFLLGPVPLPLDLQHSLATEAYDIVDIDALVERPVYTATVGHGRQSRWRS